MTSVAIGINGQRVPQLQAHTRSRGLPRYLFIIGAQRSGSTFLAQTLDQHPDVAFAKPLRPEPKYLLRPDLGAGSEDYESRYFRGVPEHLLRAEKSTSYIEHPSLGHHIARQFPTARCIAVLRDPVERAVSNYWFSVQEGYEMRPPEEALSPGAAARAPVPGLSASPFAYLKRGRYLDFLDGWAHALGDSRLLVLQTERIVNDPAALAEMSAFLELEMGRPTGSRDTVNAAPRGREIEASTLNALATYFQPHNVALAARFPIDLRLWRSPS